MACPTLLDSAVPRPHQLRCEDVTLTNSMPPPHLPQFNVPAPFAPAGLKNRLQVWLTRSVCEGTDAPGQQLKAFFTDRQPAEMVGWRELISTYFKEAFEERL